MRVPLLSAIALPMASIALGVARAALDDIVALATGEMPLLASGSLSTNPLFQHELAATETELHAPVVCSTSWPRQPGRRQSAVPGRRCLTEPAAGGGHVGDVAIRRHRGDGLPQRRRHHARQRPPAPAPAPRRHPLTQHFVVMADSLTAAGAVLAGHDPGVPPAPVDHPEDGRDHIECIYAKTGASTRSTATLFALQHGLLGDLDDSRLISGPRSKAPSPCGSGSATTAPPPSATEENR